MGVHVSVTEQIAVARWDDSGLLNTRGELFVRFATHVPTELRACPAPAGSETAVRGAFSRSRHACRKRALRVARLRLDERGAWEWIWTMA